MELSEFEKYISEKHPDPDSLLMQDNYGKEGELRIGYESKQIVLLAERFAEHKIIEFQKQRLIKKGLSGA